MKVISVANQKGGCGKTTTAVNLSWGLSQKGYRVLLIDLDPQAHATYALGISPDNTTADVFEKIMNNEEINLLEFIKQRSDSLFVLGSSIGLSAVEQTCNQRQDKLEILSRFIEKCNPSYDYCIIDCPPNLGVLTLNAFAASNSTIVPITACDLALRGVEHLTNIMGMLGDFQNKMPSLFYVITQYDRRYTFSKEFLKKAKDLFGKQLLLSIIRTNIHLRQATANGDSIFEFKKDSRGAQDYSHFANEIEKLTQNMSWVQFFVKDNKHNDIFVVGEFNKWQKQEKYRLKKLNESTWFLTVPLKKGTYRYKFMIDENWACDPNNQMVEDDSYGGKNSILLVG